MSNSPQIENLDPLISERVTSWLNGSYDETSKAEVRTLLEKHPEEAIDAFYKSLTFGTGGMRGLMGVGSNRMNPYTVRSATQGLANYLLSQSPEKPLSVFVGYDSRHHSREFAEETAKVFAGNGIKVFLTTDMRPTPLISFGCRFKGCNAAVMITASHNPPEYNGYKVYGQDGGQVTAPHDIAIVDEVNKIQDPTQVKTVDSIKNPLIVFVEDEVDDAYLEAIKTLSFYPEENKANGANLHIVYTSLHGTGITLAPRALRLWGFNTISFVEKQIIPDPNFPTVHSPNPEEAEALRLGTETLIAKNADILIATDPDADRVGVVAMHEGAPYAFTGNQIACICLEHICQALRTNGNMPANAAFIKTIVTSELFRVIAERYEAACFDVLTGFKYIAEMLHKWDLNPGSYHYIFGGEESLGYLLGTFSRDKDAISSSALIAEVASHAKLQGKTLVDCLHDLHETYGIYAERQISIKFEDSKVGQDQMKLAMQKLREQPFNEVESDTVVKIDDYLNSTSLDLATGATTPITLPVSDVIVYWLANGGKLMVRPSGTEPKVKVYVGVIIKEYETIPQGEAAADKKANEMLQAIKELLSNNEPV